MRPSKFTVLKIMSSKIFGEFMGFFPKGLYTFKIQTKCILEFCSEFCNLESREICMLDQKGKLLQFKFSITMQRLGIFELQDGFDLYFSEVEYFKRLGK
jgi:hypothetical protein